MITLNNTTFESKYSYVVRRRVVGSNSKIYYKLEVGLTIELSNKDIIVIPDGFIWDLSSVPRFLWGLLPPDGDFELASLIHDFLYKTPALGYSRKFSDDEMLIWSKAVSGTQNKWSFRNLDNQLRYIAVRIFGNIIWKKSR